MDTSDSVLSDNASEPPAVLGTSSLYVTVTSALESPNEKNLTLEDSKVPHEHYLTSTELRDGLVVSSPSDGWHVGGTSDCNGPCLVCHSTMKNGTTAAVLEAGATDPEFDETEEKGCS